MILIKHTFLSGILLLLIMSDMFGEDVIRCSAVESLNKKIEAQPEILLRRLQIEQDIDQWIKQNSNNRNSQNSSLITIPCVIFNVYHNSSDSLSFEQLVSQIAILNQDFNATNTDRLASSHPYFGKIGNAQLEFCIAQIDPNGNTTTGILRQKSSNSFANVDDVKYTSQDGVDGWPADEYLNIWVSKITAPQFLGQADFPGDFPTGSLHDGLVVQYNAFGNVGTLDPVFNKGRTATHEIGHWLNLSHIWGDSDCGDDLVDDTPPQKTSNFNCPAFPHVTCSNGPNGDLFMDFMDYTDDGCMSLFTNGQVARMTATLNVARSGIKTSNKCSGTTGISQQKINQIKIYPNPVQNYLNIEGLPQTKSRSFSLDIYNILGEKVYSNTIESTQIQIEMPGFLSGTYVMNIYNNEFSFTQKLTVVK